MTVAKALTWLTLQLEEVGIGTARLDSLVLLEDNTGIDRARLLADPEHVLSKEIISKLNKQLEERKKHIPLSYIRQHSEFYGRNFFIDRRVLEPRPESESLIDELKAITKEEQGIANIIDVGTGSGALIITATIELANITAYATDIDSDCIEVANYNAQKHAVNIKFYTCDLLEQIPLKIYSQQTIVVANLPYIPNSWKINTAAMHEPTVAIFGGQDGLDLYRRLFNKLHQLNNPPRYVLTESMPQQQQALMSIAMNTNYRQVKSNDFIQVFSYSA